MRALKNIDVAFICMNLPYTMPPDEAADAVKAFHPKIVLPYHYRGSDLSVFKNALAGTGIEARILEWYPKEESWGFGLRLPHCRSFFLDCGDRLFLLLSAQRG